ncbi:GH1 family beta-glucosidase [Coraliomargarita algicola]|uniref:Beta-glucosidase n=1 Tax=Coraliomargarita algicola TaxID=3092156 RepID=A0ABZ0RKE3_9BACT|nr:GH1 family beta-glucosidase [Coraliomargarita sp. J2-16]WPJ95573.1 GH1 family beta-glucosidase [Coraliomargarita sp. J2-16]
MKHHYTFPKDFLWGTATAAYQVEGAANEGGRGPSIWDTYCRMPGWVKNEHNGDVAIDHYHRFKQDVAMMKELGVKAYRFSVSWSRLLPTGRGEVNQQGLDFYNKLIDELVAADIQPWMTLFHWDLPQALEDEIGGWASKEIAKYFGEYAAVIAREFSDRVKHFMTLNELGAFTDCGYGPSPMNPPLHILDVKGRNQVRHNAILAHGTAIRALRANAPSDIKIGIAHNPGARIPAVATEENIEAARRFFMFREEYYLVPMMEGKYPDHYLEGEGDNAPDFTVEEMDIIGTPMDFIGFNVYGSAGYFVHDATRPLNTRNLEAAKAHPHMFAEWIKVDPESIYWVARFIHERWSEPDLYVTENGCGCDDRLTTQGEIHDTDRITYMRSYLKEVHRATAEGIPLKGYFAWSMFDNFEWRDGYTKRFGLHYVNYATQERIPKYSAHFYRASIASNAVL